MSLPAVLVVTGASGAGKTTLVKALEARGISGVSCHYFDSIGVPAVEMMERECGSTEAWQEATTHIWIERLSTCPDQVAVLDGQTRPSVVRAAFQRTAIRQGAIVLIDCTGAERRRRLHGERGQPELASARMDSWAAYLRGQADALALPIIVTTNLTVEESLDELVGQVESLRAPPPPLSSRIPWSQGVTGVLDHISLRVTDYVRSKAFYQAALAPLGYKLAMESASGAGFSKGPIPTLWIKQRAFTGPDSVAEPTPLAGCGGPQLHVAFAGENRAMVDAFHRAALAAGARDNGPPGLRPNYHANYYGAFVLDPDGHNIEAVCHKAE